MRLVGPWTALRSLYECSLSSVSRRSTHIADALADCISRGRYIYTYVSVNYRRKMAAAPRRNALAKSRRRPKKAKKKRKRKKCFKVDLVFGSAHLKTYRFGQSRKLPDTILRAGTRLIHIHRYTYTYAGEAGSRVKLSFGNLPACISSQHVLFNLEILLQYGRDTGTLGHIAQNRGNETDLLNLQSLEGVMYT